MSRVLAGKNKMNNIGNFTEILHHKFRSQLSQQANVYQHK